MKLDIQKIKLTKKEIDVLQAIVNEADKCSGGDFAMAEDVKKPQGVENMGGVYSSLIKKNLIAIDFSLSQYTNGKNPKNKGQIYWAEKEGFATYGDCVEILKSAKQKPEPVVEKKSSGISKTVKFDLVLVTGTRVMLKYNADNIMQALEQMYKNVKVSNNEHDVLVDIASRYPFTDLHTIIEIDFISKFKVKGVKVDSVIRNF